MINKKESIKKLLNPKSVAVIGANDKNSYAGRFIRNVQNNGYKGILYGINPKRDKVLGIQCYGSIKDVPGKIDLAVVIINARYVEDVVKECVDADVGSILIITAGFSEVDNTLGKEKERNIKKIASEKGIRVLGPNCIGFANVLNNFWGCTISTLGIDPLNSGNAALVSQSGAAGFGSLLTSAKDRNIGFKYIVTTGNEADLGVIEMVDIMLDDEDIKSIAMLIEGIKDIDYFIKMIKKAKKKDKSLSVLKIGESEVGSRAAASHTASMTGDIEVFNSLIRQYGILKADDYNELVELVKMTQ
jgi:acetyltransferase